MKEGKAAGQSGSKGTPKKRFPTPMQYNQKLL